MIKNIFIRCLMPFKKMRDRYKVRAALSKLALHKHPKLKAIGLALRESLSQTFSDEEQKWIDLIEQRREFPSWPMVLPAPAVTPAPMTF